MRFDQSPNFKRRNFLRGQQTHDNLPLKLDLNRSRLKTQPQNSIRTEVCKRIPRSIPGQPRAFRNFRNTRDARRMTVHIATGRNHSSNCAKHGP